jgi:hypothetical protein
MAAPKRRPRPQVRRKPTLKLTLERFEDRNAPNDPFGVGAAGVLGAGLVAAGVPGRGGEVFPSMMPSGVEHAPSSTTLATVVKCFSR